MADDLNAGIDRVDEAILMHLQQDGRASYKAIGARVGLSASAVNRRVFRLLSSGAIRRFTVEVGIPVESRVEGLVEVYSRTTLPPDVLAERLGAIPEVVSAFTVTGDVDAVVHLSAEHNAAFEAALEKLRVDLKAHRTRTVMLLRQVVGSEHSTTM